MQVLCIFSQEDLNSGEATAVLELPDGMTKDQAFLAWIKDRSSYWKDKDDKYILENAEYAWNAYEPKKVPGVV